MRERTIVFALLLSFVSVILVSGVYMLSQPISVSFEFQLGGYFNGANANGDFDGANAEAHTNSQNVNIPEISVRNPLNGKNIELYKGKNISTPIFDMFSNVGRVDTNMTIGGVNTNILLKGEIKMPMYALLIAYVGYSNPIQINYMEIFLYFLLPILIIAFIVGGIFTISFIYLRKKKMI